VFSDGAFENGRGTWGFFIQDSADDTRHVAGGDVPQDLIDFWIKTVGEQVITQVELFGVLMAKMFMKQRTTSRKIIYWIDNDAARDSLIRGYSDSAASLSLIYKFYQCERTTPSYLWFARVPSHSNIADAPSRGLAVATAKAFGAKLEHVCITEADKQDLKSLCGTAL
jgi:hypothetical protein